MIRAQRITVGEEPLDLTDGSQLSGVTVQWLRNASKRDDAVLLVGGDDEGKDAIPILAGESLPQGIQLGSTDSLHVRAAKGEVQVDVVLGWA